MLYIKKIVSQDLNKEIAFQYGPSYDFFHMECSEESQNIKHDITFIYKPENDSYASDDIEPIKSTIHYNAGKKEARITSELKHFIFKKCNAGVNDLIVFSRPETTKATKDTKHYSVSFFIVKQNDPTYQTYLKCAKLENRQSWNCLTYDNTDENVNEASYCAKSESRNIIFYGAPGTGKSTAADNLQKQFRFKTFRTTFHPETDYYSFIGSYKPTSNHDDDDTISYKFVPQTFINAYLYAWRYHETKKVCLIIEEINRGNCAQIFGDIFQLLDRNIHTGFSRYVIDIEEDCARYIEGYFRQICFNEKNEFIEEHYKKCISSIADIDVNEFTYSKIAIPDNLYIYATMNTSDQSLYPMDSAFKRRWDWIYIPIDYKAVSDVSINVGQKKYLWSDFLKKINERILSITQSEDKQIGQYFIPTPNNEISAEQLRDKVLFYLWNDIYKDEFGSSKSIFKSKDKEGNETQISFSDLFSENYIKLIENIMDSVGVQTVSLPENSFRQDNPYGTYFS